LANVVVGVTGGIAAYKTASLIRLFTEVGHSVQVVATLNATRFIGTTTLEALSHNKVQVVDPDLYTDVESVKHVALAKSADLIVVAPATASFMAKIAAGIADDLLTTTVLTATSPVVLAPAMHTEMWENKATQDNLAKLTERGIKIVNPGFGRLTGEDTGIGRLAELEQIFATSVALLGQQPLSGVRVLVTTGGTREKIDPARFIGNFSSGKQGIGFAKAARDLGAQVSVIAANVDTSLLQGLDHVNVVSAADLESSVNDAIGSFDLLVMAAAVADYSPTTVAAEKIKRADFGDSVSIALSVNPDILVYASKKAKNLDEDVVILGFAAESSEDIEELALTKLQAKGCDYIVANSIESGEVFNSESNSILLVSKAGVSRYVGSKYEVARQVLEVISSKVVRNHKGGSK
jgi:phosphopantothenoylcysteine decarboxylase / phosphopantothenate---cysteine ligase